jgi:hypothetical protein
VRETAERLGVNFQRVRALTKTGQLTAEYDSRQILIDPSSVERRARQRPLPHRVLQPANAWALLALASGDPSLAPSLDAVSPSARSRLRARLRDASLPDLVPLLRKRAQVRWLHADDADLGAIMAEADVVATGISVADAYRFDIAGAPTAELYATSLAVAKLTRKHALEPSARANVVLHVVSTVWPFAPDTSRAPALVAAVDLAESPDQRTARAGREYLAKHA